MNPRQPHRSPSSACLHPGLLMPRWLLSLALCCLAVVPLHATDAAAAFDAANRLYAEGKFTEAATAYHDLAASNGISPALLFNLGNAHFKSGRMGASIVAYREAAHLAPRDPDVRANLKFARAQVQGPTLRSSAWQDWLSTLSLREGTWLAAAALWVTLALLTLRQLRPAWRPALQNWTWLAAGLTLIFGALLALRLQSHLSKQIAIITSSDATVRNSPFDESPAAFTANDGAEFVVLDRKRDWLQVSDGAHRIGWLKSTNATLVAGS